MDGLHSTDKIKRGSVLDSWDSILHAKDNDHSANRRWANLGEGMSHEPTTQDLSPVSGSASVGMTAVSNFMSVSDMNDQKASYSLYYGHRYLVDSL